MVGRITTATLLWNPLIIKLADLESHHHRLVVLGFEYE